jgi:hypothetical protein
MLPSYTFKKSGDHISQRRDFAKYLRKNSGVKDQGANILSAKWAGPSLDESILSPRRKRPAAHWKSALLPLIIVALPLRKFF